MKRFLITTLTVFEMLFLSGSVYANMNELIIQSDSSWLVSTTFEERWAEVDFDDSSWVSATAPAPNSCGSPKWSVGGFEVYKIWSNRSDYGVYFRKSFLLNKNTIDSAIIYSLCDDDHEIYGS